MRSSPIAADEIFDEALRRPPGSERAEYLDHVYGDDATARARMERLLLAHGDVRSFLEAPATDPLGASEFLPPIAEQPGTVIGPYKLLEQIGEGGFGVVFLAEQEKPVRRRVALKVIKPGMDTREVIARFEAERQALALMDHPNIAKVLDAGTTGAGSTEQGAGSSDEVVLPAPRSPLPASSRPYFVMELVQGVPITEYCDQCQLTTRERLELFITVCQAVQHAHQKGIIHRDIKPTNVLVGIQDGKTAPKIIDFGVAKAIGEQSLTERTLTTAFAQMIGSPLYMSPEQAELSPLGVDTRSDIYSLGVLLYELLTGETPFDKDRLHAASYDEMRRIIREEEPPRPSARLSSLSLGERAGVRETANLATTIAERRRSDARRLIQTIRGELDWIVMKCLDKDRNRRYESAGGLARDIERHLHDEPVQACPPSAVYRFRKFARRNKTRLVAGGAIAAALVIGIGLAASQYLRATTESARAQAVSNLLQAILASSNPDETKSSQYAVSEVFDEFSPELGDQLADYHFRLGELLTRQSRAVLSPDDAQRLAKDAALRLALGQRHFQRAIDAYDRVAIEYPDDFERRLKASFGLVEILKVCVATPGLAKEVDEVNRRLEAELPRLVAAFSDSSEYQRRSSHVYVEWINALASFTAYLQTAEHAQRESIDIIEKLLDSDPNQHGLWMYLANMYVSLGDTQERSAKSQDFAAAYERAIRIYQDHAAGIAARIAADETAHESLRISSDYVQLAYFLARHGREDEAAELVRQAALHLKRVTEPVASISSLVGVALLQLRLGDEPGFRETCQAVADVPVASVDDLTIVRSILPCCCGPDPIDDMNVFVKRAEQLVANNSLGQRHVVLYVAGAALFRAGQYDRAAERLEDSIAAYPSDPPPGHDVINWQRLFLAMTKWKQGRQDDARRLLAETLPALDKEMRSPSCVWLYRLGLELLRDEAKALIEPNDAEEAPSNDNPTPTNTLTPDP